MQLKVKTLTGKELELNVEKSDAVLRLKELIEQSEGIGVDQQRLIFNGKQLADDKTVEFYNFSAGDVLHMVLALRGGAF
jgi:ubiquitin-like protein Nedd8